MEPLIVKAILKSKLVADVGVPEIYPQLNVIQKKYGSGQFTQVGSK